MFVYNIILDGTLRQARANTGRFVERVAEYVERCNSPSVRESTTSPSIARRTTDVHRNDHGPCFIDVREAVRDTSNVYARPHRTARLAERTAPLIVPNRPDKRSATHGLMHGRLWAQTSIDRGARDLAAGSEVPPRRVALAKCTSGAENSSLSGRTDDGGARGQ